MKSTLLIGFMVILFSSCSKNENIDVMKFPETAIYNIRIIEKYYDKQNKLITEFIPSVDSLDGPMQLYLATESNAVILKKGFYKLEFYRYKYSNNTFEFIPLDSSDHSFRQIPMTVKRNPESIVLNDTLTGTDEENDPPFGYFFPHNSSTGIPVYKIDVTVELTKE